MDPHNHSLKPAGQLAQCLPAAGHRPRFPLSLGSRDLSRRRRVTARHADGRDGGRGGGDTAIVRGAAGWRRPGPRRCTPGPAPHPSGTKPRRRRSTPPCPRRWHPGRRPPGRTHQGPRPPPPPRAHPPQPRTHRRRRSRRTARFPAAAAAPGGPSAAPRPWQRRRPLAMPGPGPGGGWERPPRALGPHAGRPPPPLRHPGPPQPARRFRIPAARPGDAAARVAAAAAERVRAQGPGRTARFGRNGPRAAPSGAGGRPPGAPTRRP